MEKRCGPQKSNITHLCKHRLQSPEELYLLVGNNKMQVSYRYVTPYIRLDNSHGGSKLIWKHQSGDHKQYHGDIYCKMNTCSFNDKKDNVRKKYQSMFLVSKKKNPYKGSKKSIRHQFIKYLIQTKLVEVIELEKMMYMTTKYIR